MSSLPPFIPVTMVPTSYFTTLFPHVAAPVTPVVFPSPSNTQPVQFMPIQHVQPITTPTTSLSIMNQSDVDSPSVPHAPQQASVVSSEMSSTPANILAAMTSHGQTTTTSHNMIEAPNHQPVSMTITRNNDQSPLTPQGPQQHHHPCQVHQ